MRLLALAALLALTLPLFAHDVEGWVYAPDGTPVKGAAVTAYLAEGSAEEAARKAEGTARPALASAKSGDGGYFRLTGLSDPVVELDVKAEGFTAEPLYVLVDRFPRVVMLKPPEKEWPSDGSQEVAAESRRGSISGVVRLDGKPLAGVPLLVRELTSEPEWARVVSDANGRYHVSGLLPHPYVVVPEVGFEPRLRLPESDGQDPQIADLETERTAVIDVPLGRAPMITGRVVDAGGKGVAGAHVQVMRAEQSLLDFPQDLNSSRTFGDGRYAIVPLWLNADQDAVVVVTRRLHSTIRSEPFVIGDGNHRVDMVLPPFQAVTLRVVDGEKKPVAKARVVFAASEEMPAGDDDFLLIESFLLRAARTNAAGEMALHLAPGTYHFAATAPGFQPALLAGHAVSRPSMIDLPLAAAGTLRGRIHRNGAGVAEAHVWIEDGDGNTRRGESTTTAADGTFEIGGLAHGKVHVRVYKAKELIARKLQATVPSTVDVALPPAGTLSIRAIDSATREPVRDTIFTIGRLDPAPEDTMRGGPALKTVDGVLSLTLSPGMYRILAHVAGYKTVVPGEARVREGVLTEVEIMVAPDSTSRGSEH